MSTTRTSVFISYSHADERWCKLVEKHLAPLRRDHHLRIWSDHHLLEGEPWLARIQRELATARVGILLISANFMASDFIYSDELPPLLAAAKKEGVTLLSVMMGYCHFAGSPLSKLQAFNKPDRPLSALTTPQRDKEMARLCARLLKLFGLKPGVGVGKAPAAGRTKAVAPAPRRAPKTPPLSPELATEISHRPRSRPRALGAEPVKPGKAASPTPPSKAKATAPAPTAAKAVEARKKRPPAKAE